MCIKIDNIAMLRNDIFVERYLYCYGYNSIKLQSFAAPALTANKSKAAAPLMAQRALAVAAPPVANSLLSTPEKWGAEHDTESRDSVSTCRSYRSCVITGDALIELPRLDEATGSPDPPNRNMRYVCTCGH